jgi:threonine/homoserine/homoserine lactone efflux protein
MIEVIILGLGVGLISSFVTGPVFFAMIKTSIEKGFRAGFALASGVIISDIILIGLVLFGTQLFTYQAEFDKYVGIVGGLFVLGVGLYYLLARSKLYRETEGENLVRRRSYVLKGFLMCILTPSTLMFWVIVSGIISVKLNNLTYEKIICFGFAMLTQISIDGLKTYYAAKLGHRIEDNTLRLLNRIAGLIIIGFAIWLIVKTYLKYY